MKEVITWDDKEFSIGDSFSVQGDYRVLTIIDMFKDYPKTYVVLKYHTYDPELWDAEHFAYCVDEEHFVEIQEPEHEIGDRFVHQYNNTTVEVLGIAPRTSVNGERMYFVLFLNDRGLASFNTVGGNYLNACIPLGKEKNPGIPKLEFPEGVEFPSVSYNKKDKNTCLN